MSVARTMNLARKANRAEGRNLRTLAAGMQRHAPLAERKLWAIMRSKKLRGWKFARQFPVGRQVAQFACPSARLVIEFEGEQHSGPEGQQRDAELQKQGFRILRLWIKEILTNTEEVTTRIVAALDDNSPRPAADMGAGADGA